MRFKIFSAGLFFFLAQIYVASAQEAVCVRCHEQLIKRKVVHGAAKYSTGCSFCHSGIISRTVPHKRTNTREKGLIASLPDLCYNCHDRGMFAKKDVHAALGMGCTSCHNPHSTDAAKLLVSAQPTLCYNCHDRGMFAKKDVHAALGMGCTSCHNPHSTDGAKLLVSAQPTLCYNCHDKGMFSKKNVHAAIGTGCISCHNPHSSDEMALLATKPSAVCLGCHEDVLKKPHMDTGVSSTRHPVVDTVNKGRGEVQLRNRAQSDKPFYCGSCHNPHSTDTPHLLRFNAQSSRDLCKNCHNK